MKDNHKALKKGNHKSAKRHVGMLRSNIKKEVTYGFQFPFDPSIIKKIPNSVVSTGGISEQ